MQKGYTICIRSKAQKRRKSHRGRGAAGGGSCQVGKKGQPKDAIPHHAIIEEIMNGGTLRGRRDYRYHECIVEQPLFYTYT